VRILSPRRALLISLALTTLSALPPQAVAQNGKGSISGTITDTQGAILPGARVSIDPTGANAVSNNLGQFTISNVPAGSYSIKVSYLGFGDTTGTITVASGQTLQYAPTLTPATQNQQVVVTSGRSYGDAEALNEERTSNNILNVLPAAVITSLPNANVADAVGRLPGVTLERDEGEGKYVQIRGTEPRLSNLTIDGMNVPSPEGGVRQVKLDTIPADLVESVQINKTLQANQEGDAIGGSVNIITKTAGDGPDVSLYGAGGFTPIDNTVPVAQSSATVGKRWGTNKQWGAIISGSYDYNGRGINDIEPVPTIAPGTTLTPAFSSIDLRDYVYDRTRYGLGGAVDYKLSDRTTFYVRGLYSNFHDYGWRWDYLLNDNPPAGPDPNNPQNTNLPQLTTERRLPIFSVGTLLFGGSHSTDNWLVSWQLNAARSEMQNPINGGESIDTFNYGGSTSNCHYASSLNKSKYRPQWAPACYAEAYNSDNMILSLVGDSAHGKTAQLNLQANGSVARNYEIGSHFGIFEFGAKIRNSHKFDDSYELDYTPNGTLTATQFQGGYNNNQYYDGSYPYGPTPRWDNIDTYRKQNPGAFTLASSSTSPPVLGGNSNNFGLVERVTAGYIMNTFDFGRIQVIGGLRIEGTQVRTTSFDSTANTFTVKGSSSYVSPLPDASIRARIDKNSDVRFVYGRGISRPDPQFLTAATAIDNSFNPPQLTIGNPALKPEHANSYDILYENYFNSLGAFQAGYFYKSLTDPIVQLLSTPTSGPNVGFQVNQANNAGSAHIQGIELNFQQRFTYLPGLLNGIGLSANYSYTTSQAKGVNPGNRSDNPALLRQAPNTWNISPTYDKGRYSLRVGMAYNGPNIFQYQYTDGAAGGLKGPSGDVYLYSHFQVDAQGSIRLHKGLEAIVSGLNLNNDVFGFYYGSSPFPIQREYYKPTYTFGLRWTQGKE
jgi:TonB-dependent receptor